MSKPLDSGFPPADRVDDVPRILEALGKAVRKALQRHKQAGNPIAIWRNNRVEWIPADQIPVDHVPDDESDQ